VSWVEVLPNDKTSLVVWEIAREDHVDVLASSVTPGKTPSPSLVLAHDALGWDAAATPKGAAIVTIVPQNGAPERADEGKLGRVLYAEVDDAGKVSPPVPVSAGATAQHDVVIARAAGRSLVAWTDIRDIDSSVYVAAIEEGGQIVSPEKRATSPVGEQALVSLVSAGTSSKKALLAWEDLLRVPRDGRLIHLATIDADASLGKERATLVFSSNGPPDITSDGDGFAAMTLAPASLDTSPNTKDTPIWPIFVRFGPDLAVRAAEPVRAEAFASNEIDENVPYWTRGLSCLNGACTTLASSSGSPATLAMVSLPVRASTWRAPAWRDPDDTPPRALSLSALYDGDHLARVASTDVPGGGSLAAWITYFIESNEPAKGAKKDETFATVAVRSVSAQGAAGKTQILSRRGLPIGGVAVASALGGKNESALVWVSRDKTEAQVQIAKLGPEGDKLATKALTTVSRKPSKNGVPSEVSDVAVAYKPPNEPGKTTDDGFVVAWVDTRDGNAEVYAASVDRTLRKVVSDRRITEAPGDSAEVQIAVRGRDTFLVWSDARQAPDEGNGDIYVVRLDTRTLQKAGPEIRLFSSAAHSRSPTLSVAGDRLVVAWIEEPSPDAKGDDTDSGVRIAMLDERGNLLGSPRLVRGEEQNAVTSITLACTASKCRGVLTSAVRESMILDAFEFAPGAPPGPLKSLAALTGGVNADVSPSFSSSTATSLFFGDDTSGGSGRVRLMTLAWP